MEERLKLLEGEYRGKILGADTLLDIDKIFLDLFGKNGLITKISQELSLFPKEELGSVGTKFNTFKKTLEGLIEEKRSSLREIEYQKLESETLDLEEAQIKNRVGSLHPLTVFENEIVELFSKLGFQLYSAPHIDSDYYNFEVLNIPSEHAARDLWDTLYIESLKDNKGRDKLLLRTHTSNAQVRIMREFKPPIRMMVLDRCFRYENLDARHAHTFDQFELVYVDKDLSMANLQYLSEYFLQSVLGKETEVRMRPKYYPFVEPGVGIDGKCMFCKGKGCNICGYVGWLELGGAGMIHPQVLKNGGIDPEVYTGIAWGPGLERILMLKHATGDLRLFRSGDLNFLKEISTKKVK